MVRLLRGLLSREVARSAPLYLAVSLTRRCNFRCRYCKFHSSLSDFPASPEPGIDIPLEMLERLFAELEGKTHAVIFAGEGEPLVYPRLVEAIAAAKARGLKVNLITNGLALTRDTVQKLIELELDQLTVSVWANTDEEFEILHPGFDRRSAPSQIDGLELVSELKTASASPHPLLCLHQPIVRDNFRTVSTALERAIGAGCDRLTFAPSHTWRDRPAEHVLTTEEQEELLLSLSKIEDSIQRHPITHNIKTVVDLYAIGERVWESLPCYTGWFYSLIQADGTVFPCGRSDLALGNLRDAPFLDIWNSRPYRQFRRAASNPAGLERLQSRCVCGYCTHLRNSSKIHRIFRHVDRMTPTSRAVRDTAAQEAAAWLKGSGRA